MAKLTDEQVEQAVDLRLAGWTWDQIASEVGAARTTVHRAVQRWQQERAVESEQDLRRLDLLLQAVWSNAVAGQVDAVDRAMKILDRARMLRDRRPRAARMGLAFSATVQSLNLGEVDSALLESGRVLAEHIDQALAKGDGPEITKTLYLVPHLVNVLKETRATPAARAVVRKQAEQQSEGASVSPFDQMRNRAEQRKMA